MKYQIEYKDGKIDRSELEGFIKKKGEGVFQVSIRKGNIRTLDQNNYYWMLMTIIGSELGYFPYEVHLLAKAMFGKLTTTDSTRGEFCEYVDNVRNYFLIEWGIMTPDAEQA